MLILDRPAQCRTVLLLRLHMRDVKRFKLVGASQAFQRVLELARQVAATKATVLITGETGTGKELLARSIHDWSARHQKPFLELNCAALPVGLVETELFGHERGAFTGAECRHFGKFELADQGTLFLDEIGEMPLEAQAKVLRVLQEHVFYRVGGKEPIPTDVRVIAATNVNIAPAIARGTFRADLYFRLSVFPIYIPPLRERPEDIPLLAQHFLEEHSIKLERPCREIDRASLDQLISYSWPGNIRELENVVARAVILSNGPAVTIGQELLMPFAPMNSGESTTDLQEIEKHHILQTLARTMWRIEGPEGAADLLGIPPSTLRSRLKKLRIQRPRTITAE
jgi:formate hydrogenlyase transcriptional activator